GGPHELYRRGPCGSQAHEVAITGFGLALSGLLLPYLFVYNPMLLFVDFHLGQFLFVVIMAIIGIYSLSSGIIGMQFHGLAAWERLLFVGIGISMVTPLGLYKVISLGFFLLFTLQNVLRHRKHASA
ncbi:MAG TPA: hypothetical protein PLA80_07590, partial [Synergistaceae bacterium]|nr:hypothetical protein [Synergistaceae bacterium]